MRQGTTPLHEFVLPMSTDILQEIEIVYAQGGRTVMCLHMKDMDCEGNKAIYRLTQEDTFHFGDGGNVEIQVRVKTNDGNVLGSDSIYLTVDKCLSTEVL